MTEDKNILEYVVDCVLAETHHRHKGDDSAIFKEATKIASRVLENVWNEKAFQYEIQRSQGRNWILEFNRHTK